MPMFNTSNPFRSSSSTSGSSTQSSQRRGPARKPTRNGPPPRSGPPPPDPRLVSLSQLDQAEARLAELQRSFVLPPHLSFDPKSRPNAPKLDYSPGNAPFHAYDEALTKLLISLDGVDSCGGDLEIRSRRKLLVVTVEKEIERLDDIRKNEYAKQQQQLEGVSGGRQQEHRSGTGQEGHPQHVVGPPSNGHPSLPPGIPLPPRDYPQSAVPPSTSGRYQAAQSDSESARPPVPSNRRPSDDSVAQPHRPPPAYR